MENDLEQKNKNNDKMNTVPFNSPYDKYKELLMKLLKEKLDTKLCRLEKRHKNHNTILKITTEEIKNITDWSSNAFNQIKEKLKKDKNKDKDKEKQISQTKLIKAKKKESSSLLGKPSFLKTKTPLRGKISKSFLLEETKIDTNRTIKMNKSLTSSKTVKSLGTKSKSFCLPPKDKKKINSNNNNNNNQNIQNIQNNDNDINMLGNNYLGRPSIISSKTNKSNKTIATSKTPKNKKILTKTSKKSITPLRKKTPFRKKNNNNGSEKTESVNSISHTYNNKNKQNSNKQLEIIKKTEENKALEEINMNKMESALQKDDDLLNDNDPLLIAPITDSDFHGKIINSEVTALEKIDKTCGSTFNFNMEKNIDDKLYYTISDYLSINDLIQFKNISKKFYKLFNVYIINKLQKDKEFFIEKKNSFKKDELPPKMDFKDFNLSKGSIKAIKLLNEPSLNQIFKEESSLNDDRLVIYRIFFQLIKHPYQYIPKERKKEFWQKCQKYFSNEINGKTGELLQKILDDKMINIEGDNLYKIYKLAENNLNKIYPNYFSKLCGATGLLVFFIKDILDFVGISNDIKIQNKAYWSYEKIIESLDNKMNHIKKLENK